MFTLQIPCLILWLQTYILCEEIALYKTVAVSHQSLVSTEKKKKTKQISVCNTMVLMSKLDEIIYPGQSYDIVNKFYPQLLPTQSVPRTCTVKLARSSEVLVHTIS